MRDPTEKVQPVNLSERVICVSAPIMVINRVEINWGTLSMEFHVPLNVRYRSTLSLARIGSTAILAGLHIVALHFA